MENSLLPLQERGSAISVTQAMHRCANAQAGRVKGMLKQEYELEVPDQSSISSGDDRIMRTMQTLLNMMDFGLDV